MNADRLNAHARTLITLAVLVTVMLIGVTWAFSAVTKPFPAREDQAAVDSAICSDTPVVKGEKIRPSDLVISVLNSGTRGGLANQTLQKFVDQGFGPGELGNAPSDADVIRAQIWTTDPTDPGVLLVRTYLGPKTQIVDRDGGKPGVNVVVGNSFSTLKKGKKKFKVERDATVCTAPAPTEAP